MQIDRRITNGLAWAGALLVVGIPAADLLSAQFLGNGQAAQVAVIEPVAPVPAPASQRPDEPVKVAEAPPVKLATPAPTAAANPADPLNAYLQSGKKLPSYITGGTEETAPAAPAVTAPVKPVPATAAAEPARPPITTPAAPAPVATDPVQVASLPPDKIAPVPMPLSMRPKPVAAYAPVAPSQQVVVRPAPPVAVTADDLQDWESGPLSEFLASRQQQAEAPQDYRPGGFYLDEAAPPEVYDRYVGPIDPPIFLPFTN
ncbi:hypothetical protein FF80_02650 [Devosia sp. LC5]|uniref:hypothetical protein n=1 Tax=Devosia sp. LC5 TaxID=1502724 RepID=UPI0004E3D9DA|nr:hypothetical protein [Devosia sp. LC5]KFC66387.1 hypothetical protein FF80_02650 [Devosia sp. LC5]